MCYLYALPVPTACHLQTGRWVGGVSGCGLSADSCDIYIYILHCNVLILHVVLSARVLCVMCVVFQHLY